MEGDGVERRSWAELLRGDLSRRDVTGQRGLRLPGRGCSVTR